MSPPLPPPSKKWGQNYLVNEGVQRKIIQALDLAPGDRVVEIGAGRGAITAHLLQIPEITVVAVEPHPPSAVHLRSSYPSCEVVQEDASRIDFGALTPGPYKVVGNLPYNVASRILVQLARTALASSERWIIMVQREMAERITAHAGTRAYGSLSVAIQLVCDVKLLFHVQPGSFFPAPKVVSSVISCTPNTTDPAPVFWVDGFAQKLFSQRKKMLRKALPSLFRGVDWQSVLDQLSLEGTLRVQQCTPGQIAALARAVPKSG